MMMTMREDGDGGNDDCDEYEHTMMMKIQNDDDADKDDVVYLLFHETFKDFLRDNAKPGMYENPDAVPTPATIDTMFELEIPIVGEMYETFCEHYGI